MKYDLNEENQLYIWLFITRTAQLYATAFASKEQTGGGEGVEVVKNEPYEKPNEKGQYTYKIFRLASRVPAIVKAVAPAGALDLYEEVSEEWSFSGFSCSTLFS